MAVSELESAISPGRTTSADQLTCFIGPDVSFSGELVFNGVMRLEGHFSGLLTSPKGILIVGAGCEIDASIEVGTAEIYGAVKGELSATERVVLKTTANVRADLETRSLVVEDGAIFDGRCRMSGGPSASLAVRRKLRSRKQQREKP